MAAQQEPRLSCSSDDALQLRDLAAGRRRDGRSLLELRSLKFAFSRREGCASCEVLLGCTR